MRNTYWLSLALVALLLGGVVAGCGKDDKGSSTPTEAIPTQLPRPSPPSPASDTPRPLKPNESPLSGPHMAPRPLL